MVVVSHAPHMTAKFHGRSEELKRMDGIMAEAKDGRGKVVIISGEPGTGKTRLMQELAKRAVDSGWRFFSGKCISQKDSDPYLPFVDALKSELARDSEAASGSSEGAMGVGFTGLASGMSERTESYDRSAFVGILGSAESQGQQVNFQNERGRMFHALTKKIIELSEKQPVMLFIDDLQWADNASLQLLYYIALNVTSARVVICCALRPREIGGGENESASMEDTLRRMRLENLLIDIKLENLARNEISSMAEDILGTTDVPDTFVDKLFEISDGNPFFAEEVIRALIEEGTIKKGDETWHHNIDVSLMKMPETVKDATRRRLERMDEETKRVLMCAAVIGDQFTFDVLHRVTGMDVDRLLNLIDALIKSGTIHEDKHSKDESFVFDHKQTATVIYNEMTRVRTRHMHKQVGEALESIYAERIDEFVFALARHFTNAKEPQKALKYNVMAGDKSRKLIALDEAISYYSSALGLLKTAPNLPGIDCQKETVDLNLVVGDLYYQIGNWASAGGNYEESVKASRSFGDESLISKALRKLADAKRRQGMPDAAERLFYESLAISEKLGDVAGIAQTHKGLGYVYWRMGDYDRAREHYNQCISRVLASGDMHTAGIAYCELGNVHSNSGDVEKAIEYYNMALTILSKFDDLSEMARVYNNLGDAHMNKNDWAGAISNLEKCMVISGKTNNRNYMAWSLFNAAESYSNSGNPDKALEYCSRSLKISESIGDKIGIYEVYKNRGIAYRAKGEMAKAIENHAKSIELAKELNLPYDMAKIKYEMAMTYKAAGDWGKALSLFHESLETFTKIHMDKKIEMVAKEIAELEMQSK